MTGGERLAMTGVVKLRMTEGGELGMAGVSRSPEHSEGEGLRTAGRRRVQNDSGQDC